jgi:hypothetical protein
LASFAAFRDGEYFLNTAGMRRTLVLTDEAARHPFLASLPPHVRAVSDEGMPAKPDWRKGLTRKDWRDILLTYTGAFLAVSIFMA